MRPTLLWTATAALASCGAAGQPVDRPAGPVADAADIVPPAEEQALDRTLRDFQRRSGVALVVATIPSLGGEPIEQVATDMFNRWQIGDERTHRGLLILVAPEERRVRIEVGCTLERAVTDERAAAVIRTAMVPRFRTGDLAGGIAAGADATMQAALENAAQFGAPPLSPACQKRAA